MKKMRKPLSLLLSAVLLISLLAGCGGKPEPGPGSATAQTPGTTQTAEGSQQGTGAADGNAAAGGTESGTAAGSVFNNDRVSVTYIFSDVVRSQSDPEFIIFDFSDTSDLHDLSPPAFIVEVF